MRLSYLVYLLYVSFWIIQYGAARLSGVLNAAHIVVILVISLYDLTYLRPNGERHSEYTTRTTLYANFVNELYRIATLQTTHIASSSLVHPGRQNQMFCIRYNNDFCYVDCIAIFILLISKQKNVTYYNAIIQQDDRYASTRIHAVDWREALENRPVPATHAPPQYDDAGRSQFSLVITYYQ